MDFQETLPRHEKKSKKHKKNFITKNYHNTDSEEISEQLKKKTDDNNCEILTYKTNKKHKLSVSDDSTHEILRDSVKKHKKKKHHGENLVDATNSISLENEEITSPVKKKKKKGLFIEVDEIKQEPLSPEIRQEPYGDFHSDTVLHHSIHLEDIDIKSEQYSEESFDFQKKRKKKKKKKHCDDSVVSTDYSLHCSLNDSVDLDKHNENLNNVEVKEENTMGIPSKKKNKHRNSGDISAICSDLGLTENTNSVIKSKKKKHKAKEEQVSAFSDTDENRPKFKKQKHKHTEQSIDLTDNTDKNGFKRKKKKHKSCEVELLLENDSVKERKTKKRVNSDMEQSLEDSNTDLKSLDDSIKPKKKKKHKTDSEEPLKEEIKIEEHSAGESDFSGGFVKKKKKKKKKSQYSEQSEHDGDSDYKNFKDKINRELESKGKKIKSEFLQDRYSYSPERLDSPKIENDFEPGSSCLENDSKCDSKHFLAKSCSDDNESSLSYGLETSSRISANHISKESSDTAESKSQFTVGGIESSEDEDDLAALKKNEYLHGLLRKVINRNALNEKDGELLENLKIQLPWPVPELHMIETRVAGRPTESQRQQILALNVPIKTGYYENDEDEKIRNNFVEFCQDHKLPLDCTPFLNFVHQGIKCRLPTIERIKFVRYLAHGLENRMLCSVYNRFKRLFSQNRNGRFTDDEDNLIIQYMRKHTGTRTPYADLAKMLHRDKLSIEKRCIKLVKQFSPEGSVIKWNTTRIDEFMHNLMEVLQVNDIEELKGRDITPKEWQEMSERMKLPVNKLRRAWSVKIARAVFLKHKMATHSIQQSLVSLLTERGENKWKTVDWHAVADEMQKKYEGVTPIRLRSIMKQIAAESTPEEIRRDLGECLHYLKKSKKFALNGGSLKKINCKEEKD